MRLMIATCHEIRYKRCRSSGRLRKKTLWAQWIFRVLQATRTGVHLVGYSPSLSSSYAVYLVDVIDLMNLVRVAQ
jgi:hypothetical protein